MTSNQPKNVPITKTGWAGIILFTIGIIFIWMPEPAMYIGLFTIVPAGIIGMFRFVAALERVNNDTIENTIKETGMTPAEAAQYRATKELASNQRATMYGTWSK